MLCSLKNTWFRPHWWANVAEGMFCLPCMLSGVLSSGWADCAGQAAVSLSPLEMLLSLCHPTCSNPDLEADAPLLLSYVLLYRVMSTRTSNITCSLGCLWTVVMWCWLFVTADSGEIKAGSQRLKNSLFCYKAPSRLAPCYKYEVSGFDSLSDSQPWVGPTAQMAPFVVTGLLVYIAIIVKISKSGYAGLVLHN